MRYPYFRKLPYTLQPYRNHKPLESDKPQVLETQTINLTAPIARQHTTVQHKPRAKTQYGRFKTLD